jgi:hypothetical protein
MKPNILLLTAIIPFLLASTLFSNEIEVGKPVLMGQVPVKVRKYDSAAQAWAEVDGYGYAFMIYLLNQSDDVVTVVTGGLSQQTSSGNPKQEVKLGMNQMNLIEGGALIVPSREDLRLVELRPGEAAAMKIELKMSVPLEDLTVIYQPEDFYDGRFGYWVGKVKSEALILPSN